MSREIAKILRPGHRLVCVEPRVDLLAYCRQNVEPWQEGVVCQYIPGVVSRVQGSDVMFPVVTDWINARLDHPTEGRGKCRAVTLGELVGEFPHRYQIVSDVEGGEESFLRESSLDVLERCSRMIIELHDTEAATVDELVTRSVRLGFSVIDRYGNVCVFVRP